MNGARALVPAIALTLAHGLPGPAMAEGARQVFSCVTTQLCDGAGRCAADGAAFDFTLSPVSVDAHGSGAFVLTRDAQDHAAVITPDLTLIWTGADGQFHQLIASGSDTALLVIRDEQEGTEAEAEIRFLTCEPPA